MNNVHKILTRKTLKVTKSFTNGFAQQVLWLEDGTQLFISFDNSEVVVYETEPVESPEALQQILNSVESEA